MWKRGYLSTLPVLSHMVQLLISSQDIRAMFYVIGIPDAWAAFFCFNKNVPPELNPPEWRRGVLFTAKSFRWVI